MIKGEFSVKNLITFALERGICKRQLLYYLLLDRCLPDIGEPRYLSRTRINEVECFDLREILFYCYTLTQNDYIILINE